MTTDEQDALEDRLNNEGKYTAFIAGIVSLHGDYTAEDLIEIWKLLPSAEVECLVCGKKFTVEVHKKYSGWTWKGYSSLPQHECEHVYAKE